LRQIAHVGVNPSYNDDDDDDGIPTYEITIPKRHRRTDGQTDDLLWHNRALRSIAR